MDRELAGKWGIVVLILVAGWLQIAQAQCPQFSNFFVSTTGGNACGGQTITITHNVANIPPGSTVDWYIGDGITYDPYNGEGTLVGSTDILEDACNNEPEVLYIMVNPDNAQVGGAGDQCDEFLVLWTGSGGFDMNDILVTNLGPGTAQWDNFNAGNAATFSCGVPLPPGPVPENAILIIQSSTANNVMINSDALCATGLPVYIISYTGTVDCMFGYFDNNSPCSSCPIMFSIDGADCDYDFDATYNPPASSIDGWAWANTGAGVFANVIPTLDVPAFQPPAQTVEPFVFIVPADFCADYGPGDWTLTAILDPAPTGGCPEIQSPYFGINIDCGAIMLSGGGQVCEGNCPDNPVPIDFTLTGTDVPYTIDIVVTVSIFPPFNIDDLEVTNGYSILVCMDDGFFPSFDPVTGILTVPDLAIGLVATVTVVSAETNSGCSVLVDPDMISLQFIQAPYADAGDDQTICAGETASLDGVMAGSAFEAMWSTAGDGDFDDPSDLNATYTPGPGDINDGSVTLTLTTTDENGSCTPATDEVVITLTGSFTIEAIAPPTMCSTSDVTIFANISGGTVNGEWETSGDGDFDDPESETTTYIPGVLDINNGSVTLQFVPVNAVTCLISNEPVTIAIVEAPDVNAPTDVEICAGDTAYFSVSVTGEFNYNEIVWFGTGGMIMVDGFDITYIPSQDEVDNQFAVFSFTVPSIYPECGETTYNIPINMTECDCPPFETDPFLQAICATADTVDLTALLAEGGSGTWTITGLPAGGNPAFIEGDLFITDQADWGNYTITYTLSNPEPGCPATSSEIIQVPPDEAPVLEDDTTACSGTSVDISVAFSYFVPANPIWISSGDGTFFNQHDLGITYVPGPGDENATVQIIHQNSIDFGCGINSDTMFITYELLPSVTFINDTVTICNQSVNGAILNFPALIILGDATGTWINGSGAPVDMSDSTMVDFDGVPPGYYTFIYKTNPGVACPATGHSIVVLVEDCACPLLMIQNPPEGVCNDLLQLPLNAFIMAGGPGTWQLLSIPPGSNPATLSGDVLITSGADPGDYFLRFTLSAAPIIGCPDSAEINVYIQQSPVLVLREDTAMCSDDILFLQPITGGSAIDLQWSTLGSGSFSSNSGLSTSYTFSIADIVNRRVDLVATTIDTFGFCAAQADTIQVNISEEAYVVWSALATTICNSSASGSIVDFRPFMLDGDINPNWADTDNSGAVMTGSNAFDFNGVAPGVYTFTATTNNASEPPCNQNTYGFEVTVINCDCPFLDIDTDPLTYCESSIYNLANIINNADPGSWLITQSPPGSTLPTIIGNQINTANASSGMYTLTYLLTDSVPDCPASVNISLVIEHFPALTITNVACDITNTVYEVLFTSDGATVTSTVGTVESLGGQQYRISNIPVGQPVLILVSSASGLCSHSENVASPDCACTLFTENIADTIRFCPGDTIVLIPIVTGAQGLPFATWVTPYGTFMQPTLPLFMPGEYIWIVIDSALCEERDTFHAVFIGPDAAEITSVSPSCPESTDGSLVITSIAGGSPPYTVQVDDGSPLTVGALPFTINNVGLGDHTVTIADIIGCELVLLATVEGLNFGTIDLGPNQTIYKGDSTTVEAEVNNIAVVNILWSNPSFPNHLGPFFVKPDVTTEIEIVVTDTAGCTYTDSVLLIVVEKDLFFIPNIFSPNNDQINDVLVITSNISEDRLISLEIFDRWGSLLYSQSGNAPLAWNGISDGKEVNPGVYVYVLRYKDIDGSTLLRRGDVTVVR